MAAIVKNQARPNDVVILQGSSQWPLELYYLPNRWDKQYLPQDPDHAELSDIDAKMRTLQAHHPRLWVMSEQSGIVDPGNNIARWLSLNAYPVARTWFKNSDAVALYESGNQLMPPRTWNARFGDWFVLEQSAYSSQGLAPGDGLAVELVWHAQQKIPQSLQLLVTLRLYDSSGHVVAERVTKPCDGFCAIDDWVPEESVSDRHGLSVPVTEAGGSFDLRLEVFSPRQSMSLPITVDGKDMGQSLELAQIAVRGMSVAKPP
jgi:hypothetical protein